MFVKDNTVSSIKAYFFDRLSAFYTASEMKLMFNELLMSRLNLSRTELMLSDSLRLSESDLLYFRTCVHRMKENEPFQHVLGSTEFYGLEIKCDNRALIPRPETEELVDWIVNDFKNHEFSIIDVCTGSGCIALALKSVFKNCTVEAVDVSKDALDLAKDNAEILNLDVRFYEDDILATTKLGMNARKWDVIVSNPPYIPVSDKDQMHANVLDYEPGLALFVSNDDALIFYRKIAELAKESLSKSGALYFEIHENLSSDVQALLKSIGFQSVVCRQDMQGKDRMIKAELM